MRRHLPVAEHDRVGHGKRAADQQRPRGELRRPQAGVQQQARVIRLPRPLRLDTSGAKGGHAEMCLVGGLKLTGRAPLPAAQRCAQNVQLAPHTLATPQCLLSYLMYLVHAEERAGVRAEEEEVAKADAQHGALADADRLQAVANVLK